MFVRSASDFPSFGLLVFDFWLEFLSVSDFASASDFPSLVEGVEATGLAVVEFVSGDFGLFSTLDEQPIKPAEKTKMIVKVNNFFIIFRFLFFIMSDEIFYALCVAR